MQRLTVGVRGISNIDLEMEIRAAFPFCELLFNLTTVLNVIATSNYESNKQPL